MRSWFTHPLALHLLWLLPVLTFLGALAWRRRQRVLALLGPMVVVWSLTARGKWLILTRSALWGLCLMGLVFAVSGPRWGRDYEQALAAGRDLIVVLDLSRSMLARDVLPSRLAKAKEALLDLSQAVERRGGHRLALVVFATRARVACPLTHDYDHFRAAVVDQEANPPHPEIRPQGETPLSGTRIGTALTLAAETHDARFHGFQDILLLTDGDDPLRDGEWRDGMVTVRKLGIPVHVIGIGDPDTPTAVPARGEEPLLHDGQPVLTRLDEEPLQEIARETRGTWTPARTHTLRLGELFQERIEPALAREDTDSALTIQRPRQMWFFAAALALLTLEMLLGRRMATKKRAQVGPGPSRVVFAPRAAALFVPLLCCLVSAAPVADWEECLRRATAAFGRADYAEALRWCEQAEERTPDPGLVAFNKAAVLYQLGLAEEHEPRRQELLHQAAQHYRACLEDAPAHRRARALFDLGNALLQRAGDRDARLLEEAIRAYEHCMQEPAISELDKDARHNLELAKVLWLRARARKPPSHAEQDPPESGPMPPDPKHNPDAVNPNAATKQDAAGKVRPGKYQPGDAAKGNAGTSQTAPAGKGNVPPLPDEDALTALSAEEVAAHLRQAMERIERERAEHLRRIATPPSRKLKDW